MGNVFGVDVLEAALNVGLPSGIAATVFWFAVAAWIVTALGMATSLTGREGVARTW